MRIAAAAEKASRTRTIDAIVLLSLALVPACYYLGYKLDWNLEVPEDGVRYAEAAVLPADGQPGVDEEDADDEDDKSVRVIETAAAALAETPEPAPSGQTAEEAAQARWNMLVKRLQGDAIAYPGRVSIYLKDLKNNKVWTYQPDDLFPSASLIKVPIMAAVFEKIHRGELNLQTKMTLRRRHRVGGSGSLKWARDGSQYTVRKLLDHMIDESDNTATKMMIEAVGMGYLQQAFPRMGLVYTEIFPEGMSLQSSRVSYENYTTAREMAMLLEKIYRGHMVDRFSSEVMIEIMKRQKSRARLAKALPPGWEIAHKTGLLRGACHDSAVIFSPDGDYVFVVLTGQNRDYKRAKTFITNLGRLTYSYYKGDEALLASSSTRSKSRRRSPDFN